MKSPREQGLEVSPIKCPKCGTYTKLAEMSMKEMKEKLRQMLIDASSFTISIDGKKRILKARDAMEIAKDFNMTLDKLIEIEY